MNKVKFLMVALVMILLISCSGDANQEREEIREPVKKSIEPPLATTTKIICDKFELVTKITGTNLDLSVDTDLPDYAEVMVGVSRSYWEKGNNAEYSIDYFSEGSNIGKWKTEHSIALSNENWKAALKAKQEEMSRLGLGFDVASISKEITVSMVVPINQSNPNFGVKNINLVGKAVRTQGIRVVEGEIKINFPLNKLPKEDSLRSSLNPLDLTMGESYIVSKQTALMPHHSPVDPAAAIQQMKQIPMNGRMKILEFYKKSNTPWYKVIAFDQNLQKIGTGWVNSTALLGQQLQIFK